MILGLVPGCWKPVGLKGKFTKFISCAHSSTANYRTTIITNMSKAKTSWKLSDTLHVRPNSRFCKRQGAASMGELCPSLYDSILERDACHDLLAPSLVQHPNPGKSASLLRILSVCFTTSLAAQQRILGLLCCVLLCMEAKRESFKFHNLSITLGGSGSFGTVEQWECCVCTNPAWRVGAAGRY